MSAPLRVWVGFVIALVVFVPIGWWIGGRITRWRRRREIARWLAAVRRGQEFFDE